MERTAARSPLFTARMAGVFYLLNIVTGALAAGYSGPSSLGYAINLTAAVCYVVVTLLLYRLFKPVNRNLSLLAAVFSLVGCIVGAVSLFHLAPVPVNNLVFFGVYCLLIGYLIFRSTFLPRTIGVLMAFAGLAWLTFLSPPLVKSLQPWIFLPGLLGEGTFTLWLLVIGVNVQRWNERAGMVGNVSPPQATT
jgi:hypothetical protein